MSGDWLDIAERPPVVLPIPVELPSDPKARLALAEQCWMSLSDKQRTSLTIFRDSRLSARRAEASGGANRLTHRNWVRNDMNYSTLVRLWTGVAGSEALDKDRLLARQDDIVETLMTPKPLLHQGIMIPDTRIGARPGAILEEIEAGAASRANEVLMKAAGLLKERELDINIGVVVGPPTLNIQVMPSPPSKVVALESVVIDAKFTEVPEDTGWFDA